MAAALAAGNTVRSLLLSHLPSATRPFKASEKDPLISLVLGRFGVEAGFPPGVIQFVNGGKGTGAALTCHMKIQKISFDDCTRAEER
jgi:aldehyde dehydrogenase (NAD+)